MAVGRRVFPLDQVLRLRGDSWSGGSARVAMEQGLQAASFDRAAKAFESAVGTSISGDSVRRITEGDGAKILALRAGEVERVHMAFEAGEHNWHERLASVEPINGQASLSTDGVFVHIRDEDWKEVKVTTFSQVKVCVRPDDQITLHHPAHEPVTELSRHSYQAILDDADHMAQWQLAEGVRRRVLACTPLTSVNDGAPWIERITSTNFPQAIQIVDWAHASQHVYAAAQLNWPDQSAQSNPWTHPQLDLLWLGNPAAVATAISRLSVEKASQTASYFSDNASRMRYADFRARAFPIGSGTVESACKTVIQHRLKCPCRGWRRSNASAMIAALTELHSGRLDLARLAI